MKRIVLMAMFLIFYTNTAISALSQQEEYYPIIFIHGHGGNVEVENTWTHVVEELGNQGGYSYYGKIWKDSVLPSGLSPRNIFLFGFYRQNDQEPFGKTTGKIGAIPVSSEEIGPMRDVELEVVIASVPPYFWYHTREYNYKDTYFDLTRESFAERLQEAVDNVLAVTNSKKVILVAHSMGGLVARAYIKWLGGEKKVYKLLTVGSPNHGIANDNRAALEKLANPSTWQFGGEYLEMSIRKHFKGKSYTEWLNEDWEEFCRNNGVRYATIAGNYDPWEKFFFKIGMNSDGVIDSDSVKLQDAEFNGIFLASHINEFPLVGKLDNEKSIVHATYTTEVIKRWIMYDQIHTNPVLTSPLVFPSPFTNRIGFQYISTPNTALGVSATLHLYDAQSNHIITWGIPLYHGLQQPHFPIPSNLSVGTYSAAVQVYDMNGPILNYNQTIAGPLPGNVRNEPPVLTLEEAPERETPSQSAYFKVKSTLPDTSFAYKLDDQPLTAFNLNNNEIFATNLEKGLHVIYIYGRVPVRGGIANKPVVYQWIIDDPKELVIQNQTISGNYRARAEVKITSKENVLIKKNASVIFSAGEEIILEPGTEIEEGSLFESELF